MGSFFGKIFGKKSSAKSEVDEILEEILNGLIERTKLELSFDIKKELVKDREMEVAVQVELYGEDEEELLKRDGQLLDSFQLFLKRVLQHRLPDWRVNLSVDSGGFRENSNKALMELVDKLKGIVLEKGKSVYCRALPPKDRKTVHQYIAKDDRVRSRSVGEGLYKKIKIYPIRNEGKPETL